MIIQPPPSFSVKYILQAQLYAAEVHFPLNELMLSHFFSSKISPSFLSGKKTSCADGYSENFLHLWNAIFDIHHLQFFVIQPFSRYIWCVSKFRSYVICSAYSTFFSLGLQIFSRKFLRKDNMSNASYISFHFTSRHKMLWGLLKSEP